MRIIYAGTPDFAVPPLKALLESEHDVIAVYTQPDRPSGRGKKLTASPVKQAALDADVPVYQPLNFKTEEDCLGLEALNADLMVVAAYGLILPLRILNAPRLGCINIHASLLPRWRGAAPIQRAIEAGDKETGITIMQMAEGLDTGDMLLKLSTEISAEDDGGRLHDRLSDMGAEALMQALPSIEAQLVEPEVQDEALATYAHKLQKAEANIDWTASATALARRIRAFNPWPVCQTGSEFGVLRVRKASPDDSVSNKAPGEVVEENKHQGVRVQCGDGSLWLQNLQLPGKRPMSVADFLNGKTLMGGKLG